MLEIVVGEDKEFIVELTDEDGRIFRLNDVTEVTALFKQSTGSSPISLKLTAGEIAVLASKPENGELLIKLPDEKCALIKPSELNSDGTLRIASDMELIVEESGKRSIVQFPSSIWFKKRFF